MHRLIPLAAAAAILAASGGAALAQSASAMTPPSFAPTTRGYDADEITTQSIRPGRSGGIVIGPERPGVTHPLPLDPPPLGGVAGTGAGSGGGSAVMPGLGASEE